MMRALLVSVLFVGAAAAQVKGPADVTIPVGRLAAVPLTIDGDESDYQVLGTDVDAFREYTTDPKQIRLRVIGYAPGTAYVVVASQKGGKLQPLFKVTVTVTGVGPTPPVPPPIPPAPVPDDPAVTRLKAAFQASGFAKAAALALGYDQCAALAAAGTTGVDLHVKCKAALKAAMNGDKIPEAVIAAVAPEMAGLPEASDAALTDLTRAAAVAVFKRIASLLRQAGGVQ